MKHLYSPPNQHTRWASFENPSAGKGTAAQENNSAKGRAFQRLPAGSAIDLLNYSGSGIITRMWLTISNRSPEMLRSLVFRCFWDGAEKPAVEAPLGDFFSCGNVLCRFENELFSSPEGRSFVSYAPMPFRKSAKITVTNESETNLSHIFYDINMAISDEPDYEALYFHCYWNRVKQTNPGEDYIILPKISGRGSIIGTSFVINENPVYEKQWWGEGEVKAYIDGDEKLPTLCGTGTEDYIGTAWAQGLFCNRYQGCLSNENGCWIFYRLHIKDPIYFHKDIMCSIQTIGGAIAADVKKLMEKGVPLIPVSCDIDGGDFLHLYKKGDALPDTGWINYFRSDDYASICWFYLDSSENTLPGLLYLKERM